MAGEIPTAEEPTPSLSWYARNRERILAEAKKRYESDPAHRRAARKAARQRYHDDPVYRAAVIARAKERTARIRAANPTGLPRPLVIRLPAARKSQRDVLRQRAMVKLWWGGRPLTALELSQVPPSARHAAVEARPRTLAEVAALFGISRERVRQIIEPVVKASEV